MVRLAAQVLVDYDLTVNTTASNGLQFGQTSDPGEIYSLSASNGLAFGQSVGKLHLKGDADITSDSHGLQFSDAAHLPQDGIASNSLQFSQSATGQNITNVGQGLQFSQSIGVTFKFEPSVAQGLQFSHAFLAETDEAPSLCEYDPVIGGGSGSLPPLTPPALVPSSTITLFYPTVSPTLSVSLRAPEVGDRDRLQLDRIERESRGGTLEVFRDPDWPKQTVFAVQITGLKESEAQLYLTFVQATLGQEVGFTDHESRSWRGYLITTAEPVVSTRDDIKDLSFEFIAEALL